MITCKHLSEQLKSLEGFRAVILGMGNVLKGDDAVGPFLCEQLAGKTCAEVIDAGTVPENYIQKIVGKNPQTLLVIDAIDFGASPGTIKVFRPRQLNSIAISTHTLSPRLFVGLVTSQIEVNVRFIGIQPAQVALGEPISEEVRRAAENVLNALIAAFPSKE
ncbi:MAG: hydrogenase 3 maturation endopeptidase HyCI [Planctomycetota bacterium]|jgi:hydrogenase 3 maturation protease